MAKGHTLQPCRLQLAFGLDTYDLQRLIANHNRITRINENELRSYFSRVTASYSTTCDQKICAQDWTASYWSSKTWVSNYQVQAFSWHIQEISNQTDNIQRHYYSLSSVTNEAHQLLHSLHVTDHYFCICRKLLLCERKTSV